MKIFKKFWFRLFVILAAISSMLSLIVVLPKAIDYFEKTRIEKHNEEKYSTAISLMNSGKYGAAIAIFESLFVYGYDNYDEIAKCEIEIIKEAQIGDIVRFGRYPQTLSDDPIEWIVIDIVDGRPLLLSLVGLEHMAHNSATWKSSEIREWLNQDFLNTAFSAAERAYVPTVTVPAHKHPKYPETYQGNDTQDKVFLLSVTEVNKYEDLIGACEVTERIRSHFRETYTGPQYNWDDWKYSSWFLRTKAGTNKDGCFATNDGGLTELYFGKLIRPAMWLDFDKGE